MFKLLRSTLIFWIIRKGSSIYWKFLKRTSKWIEKLEQLVEGRETLRRLQKIGITRWWAKDKALETIFDVNRYVVLLKTLYSIAYSDQFESKVSFEAQSILQIFLKFDTILVAFVFKSLFKYTTPVSKYLQTVSLDYLTAHQLLKSLKKQLSNMAKDSISTFDNIFKAALSFASSVNDILTKSEIELEIETILSQKRPRKVKRMFDETAADESVSAFENNKHKFRVSVYQVVIDTASRQISVRFGESNTTMQDASYLDPRNFKRINEDPSVIPQEALQSLAKMSNVERDGLVDQLISFASIYHNISNNTEYQSNITDSENDEEETLTRSCSIGQNCQKCIPCAIKLLKDFNLCSSTYSDVYIAYETKKLY